MSPTWPFLIVCGPVWSLYNIGTGCHEITQVVFWVELSDKGDSARFSLNPGSWEKGTQWSGVGLTGCQRTPGIWGVTHNVELESVNAYCI